MIEAAAEAAFWLSEDAPARKALADLLREAAKFALRRNEIAHGIAGTYETGLPAFIRANPGFVLGPPSYATNKTELRPGRTLLEVIHHAPKYAYSAEQIEAFKRQFVRLALEARGVWYELIDHLTYMRT